MDRPENKPHCPFDHFAQMAAFNGRCMTYGHLKYDCPYLDGERCKLFEKIKALWMQE